MRRGIRVPTVLSLPPHTNAESDYILIIYRAISDVRAHRPSPTERVIKLNETPNSRAQSTPREYSRARALIPANE